MTDEWEEAENEYELLQADHNLRLCPSCQRIMSVREYLEQHICNDCRRADDEAERYVAEGEVLDETIADLEAFYDETGLPAAQYWWSYLTWKARRREGAGV